MHPEEIAEVNKPIPLSCSSADDSHVTTSEKVNEERSDLSDHQDEPAIEVADLISKFKLPSKFADIKQTSERFW